MTILLRQAIRTAAHARLAMLEGTSLDWALRRIAGEIPDEGRGAVQSLLYTATRQTAWFNAQLPHLLAREPSREVRCLLEIAMAALTDGKQEAFTAVNEAVHAARSDPATSHAAGMVNAVLRRCCREGLQPTQDSGGEIASNAPSWWLRRLHGARPQDWQDVLEVQKKHPPLTLRVNVRRQSPAQYAAELRKAGLEPIELGGQAIALAAGMPVHDIPGFDEGRVSVQDAGSQLAARFLGVRDGMRVLDACAAPGGKTAHILELADARVTALEISPERTERIGVTLARLGLQASWRTADAADPASWWDGEPFDRILLDAPCTASGIVRRHPDIPWQRQPQDIGKMALAQKKLLEALWPLLKSGGRLLYVVCSVFPDEGAHQFAGFLSRHPDARPVPLERGLPTKLALAPTENEPRKELPRIHDGYFFGLLEKL